MVNCWKRNGTDRKRVCCWLVASTMLGCQISNADRDTGGVQVDAGSGCPAGIVAQLGDPSYGSTQIALTALDGTVLSESFVSTASTQAEGLAFALSGDTGLPSTAPASGRVVILDEYGTNVLTWLDPRTSRVEGQLAVGTGFESNPQDYLELDDNRALVTRWGEDGNPDSEPYDGGGDVLVIDTRTPKILSRIVMPIHDNLPARPSGMTRVGSSVAVVLQRLSLDFSTYGDAEIVQIDPVSLTVVDEVMVSGVSNCGRLTQQAGTLHWAIACTGPLDANGNSGNLSHSALVFFALDPSGYLVESSRWQASDIAGEPLQSTFDFAGDGRALVKTQTSLGGATNNRLLLLDTATKQIATLAEAEAAADGTGQGLTFGSVICAPGCSAVCVLADGDRGVLRRFNLDSPTALELPAVSVTPGLGLLPRRLSHFIEP